MSRLQFIIDWRSTGSGPAEFQETSAFLTLKADDTIVTRNEDLWSKTLRDSVLVSTYPLASWLAASWWRLNWEPLPKQGRRPDADWRMAHEMGAANHGYVWPHVVFASDNESMQLWVTAPQPTHEQSVRYLGECAVRMPLNEFQSGVDDFISAVVRRLAAVGQRDSDLAQLWELVLADRRDPEATRLRKIEAALGYDPDECPQDLIEQALAFDREMGGSALAELAPLYGKFGSGSSLEALNELREQPGLIGKPDVPDLDLAPSSSAAEPPWVRAVVAARALRKQLDLGTGSVPNETLQDLLGLSRADAAEFPEVGVKRPSGVGIPQTGGWIKFMPRKRHPVSRRFELSRFIADLVQTRDAPQWLTSTDLSTSRQKFQRAFAAEFLCPINELTAFLDEDYSESAIEDAAERYDVSIHTVTSLLANNDLIQPWAHGYGEVTLPYAVGFNPNCPEDAGRWRGQFGHG
jgi:hypothetical protein